MLVFEERGKPEYPGEKWRTNKLNPHVVLNVGIDPGAQWWKASVVTAVPGLLLFMEHVKLHVCKY